ncbi:MAG: phosphonate ABC transporter, permease protein PhnE [Rhodobiaceae bacterium]|nr:phosphonate ABC transporter, permease protein PhnE [Rhodobiaceae bacterium]
MALSETEVASAARPPAARRFGSAPGPDASPDREFAVPFRDLVKAYGRGLPPVLSGVSFDVAAGEIVGLIGANGSGKSTLLRCLAGLHPTGGGDITVLGQRFSGWPPAAALRSIRRDLGFVFQHHSLVGRLTALSNVVQGQLGDPGGWRCWHQALAPDRCRREALQALARGPPRHLPRRPGRQAVWRAVAAGGHRAGARAPPQTADRRRTGGQPRPGSRRRGDGDIRVGRAREQRDGSVHLARYGTRAPLCRPHHRAEGRPDRLRPAARGHTPSSPRWSVQLSRSATSALPPRFSGLSALRFALLIAAAALIIAAISDVAPSPQRLIEGAPRMSRLIGRMLPPETDLDFLLRMAGRLLETIEIALAGTVIGVLPSLPVTAWLAARGLGGVPLVNLAAKAFISFLRTVPDLVWALIFIASVGLGAIAGTMTIVVDTIGFCGRFFAEAFEDADKAPQQALSAIGATRVSIMAGAVLPAVMPSLINTSLFAFEKAVRSSVVLGLVGAGGIGQELKVAFDLFQYRSASTIIIAIFIFVFAMEFVTDRLRTRFS